jgi:hypothetical protein
MNGGAAGKAIDAKRNVVSHRSACFVFVLMVELLRIALARKSTLNQRSNVAYR